MRGAGRAVGAVERVGNVVAQANEHRGENGRFVLRQRAEQAVPHLRAHGRAVVGGRPLRSGRDGNLLVIRDVGGEELAVGKLGGAGGKPAVIQKGDKPDGALHGVADFFHAALFRSLFGVFRPLGLRWLLGRLLFA